MPPHEAKSMSPAFIGARRYWDFFCSGGLRPYSGTASSDLMGLMCGFYPR